MLLVFFAEIEVASRTIIFQLFLFLWDGCDSKSIDFIAFSSPWLSLLCWYPGGVRYFAYICFCMITDDKRELAQPKQPANQELRRSRAVAKAEPSIFSSVCRNSALVSSIMWIFTIPGGFIRHSNIGRRMKSISELAIGKQWHIVNQGALHQSFNKNCPT